MSLVSASPMSTPYLATKRRVIQVVTDPRSLPATQPAKEVSACLGNRYWGRTGRRSDKAESQENGRRFYRAPCAHFAGRNLPGGLGVFTLFGLDVRRLDHLGPFLDFGLLEGRD